ncbi:MAG: glycosyltransferase [Anaerolineae bacterium]|nr:glycosyltransferase [Anaerolineae bacterium]
MVDNLSKLYDAHYYAHNCGEIAYKREAPWLDFFDQVAERIVKDIQPKTVLDAGCAIGLLVEALRRRGVEAFGIDISEYAIQNVHPDIQPYCRVGSITEPFSQTYDLIVSIEVLEHMSPQDSELAVRNFCEYSDDVLFSSSPLDYKEVTHFNVNPPDYWTALFARQGFFRDVDFNASFITNWAVRFRKTSEPIYRVILPYERRLWHLLQDAQATRLLNLEQNAQLTHKDSVIVEKDALIAQKDEMLAILTATLHKELDEAAGRDRTIQDLNDKLTELQHQYNVVAHRWDALEGSAGWKVMLALQQLRTRIAPPRSIRDQLFQILLDTIRSRQLKELKKAFDLIGDDLSHKVHLARWRWRSERYQRKMFEIGLIEERPPVQPHQVSVDIIICIHNALNDVKRCLESVVTLTERPYTLVLVDDGSDLETQEYLLQFVVNHDYVALLRNDVAQGYTLAANRGLRYSEADYTVLLNSDTIVPRGWLDRFIACAGSDPHIGIVGPLSNTASWQSIPDAEPLGDNNWPMNPLPEGMTLEEMGQLLAQYSPRMYPQLPFLNGFCMLIRKAVIEQIGYFDEENFGAGYGEENDYCIRARQAGWQLVLADDTYIYHAQGRSYPSERRKQLDVQASAALLRKHGNEILEQGVRICRYGLVMRSIRSHTRALFESYGWIRKGYDRFAGRKVLFLLPVMDVGGGAGIVILTARLMRQMGVEAEIFNLDIYREEFERSYPEFEVPMVYGKVGDIVEIARRYDAVVATACLTVDWLLPTIEELPDLVRGYFIQDFEPYFYSAHTEAFEQAWNSYTIVPDLVRFCTTEWIHQQLMQRIGVECRIIGSLFDANRFWKRPPTGSQWPDRPLRVAALIRPYSQRRAPRFTMEVLRRVSKQVGAQVDIWLFGTDMNDPDFAQLPQDFAWRLAGRLNRAQVARLLSEVDIFVDFSEFQAMGLTALEAMASGAAVIVPKEGGAGSYARHRENCLVVDTTSLDECSQALRLLIKDHKLRVHIQGNAILDAGDFAAAKPTFNILDTLFPSGDL